MKFIIRQYNFVRLNTVLPGKLKYMSTYNLTIDIMLLKITRPCLMIVNKYLKNFYSAKSSSKNCYFFIPCKYTESLLKI